MPARFAQRLAAVSMTLVVAAVFCGEAFAQERWAAIAPNLENTATVVWATTKDQAEELAILACKQNSQTCVGTAASTNDMDQVFAVMCCDEPNTGCAASVGGNRSEALKEIKKVFADEGFSQCKLKNYFKAGTGEKG